jgi:hypothetical protein
MRRRVLLELDAVLVLAPTAIAVPLSLYAGGVGVPEVMAAASPLAGEFFARIMEHQFADRWFDLIAPWRREQQIMFESSLRSHLIRPVLRKLKEALEPFEGQSMADLRRYQELCRNLS